MAIEFSCDGCGQKYRVNDSLGGRIAECKHCGAKMQVPAPPAGPGAPSKIAFADEPAPPSRASEPEPAFDDSYDPPEIPDDGGAYDSGDVGSREVELDANPDDFDIADDAPAPAKVRRSRQTSILPPVISDFLLPWALLLGSLGGALALAVPRILHSSNVVLGFALLVVCIGFFFFMIVPMTMKALESGATTLRFALPNTLWIETAGLLAVPSAGIAVGYFLEGFSGAITYGVIGLIAMALLTVLMYPTGALKALTSVALAACAYLFSSAIAIGVLAGGSFLMTRAGVTLPWQPKPAPEVAKALPASTAPVVVKPVPVAIVPETPKPVAPPPVVVSVEPPKPQIVSVWNRIIDPEPAPTRWPSDAHHLIDCKPPIVIARTAPRSMFAAFADNVAFHIYDLRSGRRTGFIKEKLPAHGAIVSPDGTLVVIDRSTPPPAGGTLMGASAQIARQLDVWSAQDARAARQITFDSNAPMPAIVGFAKENRLVTIASPGGKPAAMVWDLNAASPLREIPLSPTPLPTPAHALTSGGQYLATAAAGRIAVFDLESSEIICDKPLPHPAGAVRSMSFSRDGTLLALFVFDGGTNHLVVLSAATGEPALDTKFAIPQNLTASDMLWIPTGGGAMIGNDWIDMTTGKVIATLPPQSAGQATGRAKHMVNAWQVMVEFPPVKNGTRLIYKTVNLPKKEIQTALSAQSATTQPSTQPDSAKTD